MRDRRLRAWHFSLDPNRWRQPPVLLRARYPAHYGQYKPRGLAFDSTKRYYYHPGNVPQLRINCAPGALS